MRAKRVNEIKFERGKKPVGRTSREYQESVMKEIEDLGVKFWFNFDKGEEEKEKTLEHIEEIKERVEKLLEVGVKPEDITISLAFLNASFLPRH